MTGKDIRLAPLVVLALLLAGLALEVGAARAAPGEQFAVKAAGVVLRAEPRGDAKAVMTLTPEHRLVEFERRGDWVRVGVFRQVGAFGWVAAADLEAVPRDVPAQTPPPPDSAEPPSPGPAPPYLLAIGGTPAVQYRGTCILVGADGSERTVPISGSIPYSYRLVSETASCWVRKWDYFGRMTTRLSRGERVLAELATSGPFNLIWIRSDGPWGPARALLRGGLVPRSSAKP
jgi:hypothetical protein